MAHKIDLPAMKYHFYFILPDSLERSFSELIDGEKSSYLNKRYERDGAKVFFASIFFECFAKQNGLKIYTNSAR